ncbi:MAG: ribose 5-phosphate isomerase B [Myxococcaceae bacterium]
MAPKIVLASDHAGLALKGELKEVLTSRKLTFEDLGTHNGDSVDYPDFALRVAKAVACGEATFGVLVCGTGIGMSIAANKHPGIRAALCSSEFEARMSRAHNDANVLCLGQRVVGAGVARAILEAFVSEPFEGGRHQRRVDKLRDAEGQR